MNSTLSARTIFGWIAALILFTTGILNIIYVHPVPGLFYIFLALLLVPATNTFLKNKFGFSIPLLVKIAIFLLAMWYMGAVGELPI